MTPQQLEAIDRKSRSQGLTFIEEQFLISRIHELEAREKKLSMAVSEAKEILQKADNLKCKHMTEASEWLSRHGGEE